MEIAGGAQRANGQPTNPAAHQVHDPLGYDPGSHNGDMGKVAAGVRNGNGLPAPPGTGEPAPNVRPSGPPIALPGTEMVEDDEPDHEKLYTHTDVAREVIMNLERGLIHTMHGLLEQHMDSKESGWKILKGQIKNHAKACEEYGVEPLFDSDKK